MTNLLLTAAQRRQLRTQLRKAEDARYYRRLLALLALDEGDTVAEVAQRLGVTRQTVYNWEHSYQIEGTAAALRDHYGGGRPTVWTDDLETLVLAALHQRPDQLGFPGPNWTVPLLQAYLERCSGQRLSEDTLRRQLRRLDYVWKRFRHVLPPDPECEKKTRHPPPDTEFAAPERAVGRRRDRPAVVPAPACRLGHPGPAGRSDDQREQCQASSFWVDQRLDRPPAVLDSAPAAWTG
jgi:transposase